MGGLRPKILDAHAAYIESYPDEDEGERSATAVFEEHLAWLDRVMGCPPFQIAIMHGMHAQAATALQLGRIDPADCQELATEIHDIAAKSNCVSTIALVKNVLAGWSPLSHHLCFFRSNDCVHTIICIA